MTYVPKLNHARLADLQTELLRLKTGKILAKANDWLEPISPDDMERACANGAAAVFCGCDVSFEQTISENPKVIGAVFTKHWSIPGARTHRARGHGVGRGKSDQKRPLGMERGQYPPLTLAADVKMKLPVGCARTTCRYCGSRGLA
jgi:hypothetical protein